MSNNRQWSSVVAALLVAVVALVVVLVITSGGVAEAAAPTQVYASSARTVTATGSADVMVTPDRVVITVSVETEDKDLGSAKSQNDKDVRKVLDAAKDHGVKDSNVRTEYLHINPTYGTYPHNEIDGYRVSQTIVMTLEKLSEFEELMADLLESGVDYLYGVDFQTSDLRKYKDQARELAVAAAQEKSEAMAGELGQKLGQPVSVVEEQNTSLSWYSYGWGRSGTSSSNSVVSIQGSSSLEGGTVAPGQITVSARVTVTFEMK